jgi:nicotinamidase-related amidase
LVATAKESAATMNEAPAWREDKCMADKLSWDPKRTAVLCMDCQAGIVSIYGKNQEGLVGRAGSVLGRARSLGMSVIHVQVGFRAGLPEVSARNSLFAAIRNSAEHQKLFQGAAGAIQPELGPRGEDIVITKHRISAFRGTDLEMILRAKEMETLILFGIATSGVVLSTLLEAVDLDYRAMVIQDCCADMDLELHSCLVERFFPKRGTVISAAEFLASAE